MTDRRDLGRRRRAQELMLGIALVALVIGIGIGIAGDDSLVDPGHDLSGNGFQIETPTATPTRCTRS